MKIVTIILGVLLAIGGIYCMFAPIQTYSTLSWLIGITMVAEGIGSIIVWNDHRKLGISDGWMLAGGIVSIILGIFLLGSYVARFAVDVFIAYVIAFWLVFGGIARIVSAINLRKYQNEMGGMNADSSSWVLQLIVGIAIVILGVLCIFNPVSVMISVGFLLGISIVCTGVGLVMVGIKMQ